MHDTQKSPYCHCLYFSANALARNITRMAEEAFSSANLAPSQAFLLMAANRKPGIQPSELASILMLRPSSVTRLIEKLETKDLVERKSDGKASRVFATVKGMNLDSELRAAWSGLFSAYVRLLGEDEAKRLTSMSYAATLALEKT